jgi:hypothetical protein
MKVHETFHAEVLFQPNGASVKQHLCLLIADGIDGWAVGAYYPATKESITLTQVPEIDDAKAHAEGWVRVVHRVKDVVEWIPGLPRI